MIGRDQEKSLDDFCCRNILDCGSTFMGGRNCSIFRCSFLWVNSISGICIDTEKLYGGNAENIHALSWKIHWIFKRSYFGHSYQDIFRLIFLLTVRFPSVWPCTFTPNRKFLKIWKAKFDSTVTRTTIEYFCKQLFILHRVPFVIELISVCSEALISNDRCLSEFVSAKIIYRLFESLAQVGTFWFFKFFWIHCPLFHWKFHFFLGFQSWWSQYWWWFQIGKYGTNRFNL